MATGRSDYPNQINNVLCFPGIFRGALNCRASRINEAMKLAAANAIADIKTGIRDARANVSKDDIGMIEVTVEVFDKKHLDKVVGAIEHVPGVIAVERVNA